jgi:hypothetical protein
MNDRFFARTLGSIPARSADGTLGSGLVRWLRRSRRVSGW